MSTTLAPLRAIALLFWGVLAAATAIAAAMIVQEHWFAWSHGPGMTRYWLVHSTFGRTLYTAANALLVWTAAAIAYGVTRLIRRRRDSWRYWTAVTISAAFLLIVFLPPPVLDRATLRALGAGSFGSDFMVAAAARADRATIRLLAQKGVDVNTHSSAQRLPVIAAAISADADFVKWLVDLGADVNQVDGHGSTALLGAVEMNSPEVVRLLLTLGADRTVVGSDGKRPIDVARDRGDPEIVKMLGGGSSEGR